MSERRARVCDARGDRARGDAATMRDGKRSDDADDAEDDADVEEEYVVVDLPLELKALPGDTLKFEGLDTETPKLRTVDGARYVGRYEVTVGEHLVVGFDDDDTAEARVVAKTERRLKFKPA
jgi:hypothetical protein